METLKQKTDSRRNEVGKQESLSHTHVADTGKGEIISHYPQRTTPPHKETHLSRTKWPFPTGKYQYVTKLKPDHSNTAAL